MFLFTSIAYRLQVLGAFAVMACAAHAQTAAPASSTPSTPYSSVFESYKPHTDEPIGNWKAANDTTARIGGWREYARQAQQPDNTPTPASIPKARQAIPEPIGKAKP